MDSDKTPLTRRSFLARSTALATGGAAPRGRLSARPLRSAARVGARAQHAPLRAVSRRCPAYTRAAGRRAPTSVRDRADSK